MWGTRTSFTGSRLRRMVDRHSPSTSSKIVAIIDDDDGMRRSISRLLSEFGFNTETYDSAEAFLEAAVSSKAACLVVDIDLGRMSGIELAHQLAQGGFKFPIIIMTGLDNDNFRRQAADVGAAA